LILTPKQLYIWRGFLLLGQVLPSLSGVDMDNDQVTRARNICARFAPRLAKAKDKAEADKIYDELIQSLRERVLSDEQRAKLVPKPASAPATAPKS
jgi:hypothetical protein